MAIETFNRYEHKYLLDIGTYKQVVSAISSHTATDGYNINSKPYTISNLYYDTDDSYLIRTSLSKPLYKEKLRLRAYGTPKYDSKVFIEIKKKYRGIVNKRRSVIRLDEAYKFLSSGCLPEKQEYMNIQVLREIEYLLNIYKLKPKLYLAYDRIAFLENGNSDLRISFDTNIRSRRYDLKLENSVGGTPLLEKGTYLMEIKTAMAKPLWLANILSELKIYRTSFSKYGTEYQKSISEINTNKKAII